MPIAQPRARRGRDQRERVGAQPPRAWGGSPWRLVTIALLVLGYGGYYLCRSDLSVAMPLLIAAFARHGLSPEAARIRLGAVASLGVLAYGLGELPAGFLADRLGGLRNLFGGMAGAIVFTLAGAAAGALPFFTIAWMANRLLQSLGWAGTVKTASNWFSFRSYGTVMAVISLSFLFGDATVRQFMAALLARGLSWQQMFLACAAALALIFVLCLWGLRESPDARGLAMPAVPAAPVEVSAATPWAALSRNAIFWIACGLSVGTTILRETFNIWTPTYFTQTTAMNPAQAASASALFPLLGGVSVLLCGWLSDRLGRRGRSLTLVVGLGLAAAVLLAMATGVGRGNADATVALVALSGFLIVGPYTLLAGAVALDLGGRAAAGTAAGWIDGIGYLGGVVSGYTIARVSVAFGWSGAFLLLAVIAAVSALASFGLLHRPSAMRVEIIQSDTI